MAKASVRGDKGQTIGTLEGFEIQIEEQIDPEGSGAIVEGTVHGRGSFTEFVATDSAVTPAIPLGAIVVYKDEHGVDCEVTAAFSVGNTFTCGKPRPAHA